MNGNGNDDGVMLIDDNENDDYSDGMTLFLLSYLESEHTQDMWLSLSHHTKKRDDDGEWLMTV